MEASPGFRTPEKHTEALPVLALVPGELGHYFESPTGGGLKPFTWSGPATPMTPVHLLRQVGRSRPDPSTRVTTTHRGRMRWHTCVAWCRP